MAAALQPAARESTLAAMQEVMGPVPSIQKPALQVRVLDSERFDSYERRKIDFVADPGDRVPAWLFLPTRPAGPRPGVVCLHQTTRAGKDEPAGLSGNPDLHYALELVQRGYVTIAPDYPDFGEYRFDPYSHGYSSATMKGIWNHMRAVDVLVALPQIDANRIAAVGHSLGGHNSLFLAAFDLRIKAVVTSCGFTSFAKYHGGDLTGWSHKGYMPRIADVYGKSPARMPFDFSDVLGAIAPRPVFVNAPLHDHNFDSSGVDDAVRAAASASITVVHPDAPHAFPPKCDVKLGNGSINKSNDSQIGNFSVSRPALAFDMPIPWPL